MKLRWPWRRNTVDLAEQPLPNRPELEEIATTANGRDITRGYVDGLPLLPSTDTILQAKGGGDYRVYREVLRDTQVKACLQQRKLALIAKEWTIEPGDSSRRAKKAADRLERTLDELPWDNITAKMLSGVFYGHAEAEILWARDGSEVTIEAIKVRNQRRFGFAPDGTLRLLTTSKPQGEAVPPAKFWAYSCGDEHDDDPYGIGLAHWLYWPVFFKRNGIKFWLIFLEKFGMPTAVGKYPASASEDERNRLLQALGAIMSDSGIRIPETMQIELLEAARSGTADYTALYDRMDAAIAKVVLGHTGSTDATPGRLGGESNAADVRDDLIAADADLICSSFNCTVARWLTHFNDPLAPPPRVWRRTESDPDLNAQAQRDKLIFDVGFKPTLKYIAETYGEDFVEKSDSPGDAGPPTPGQAPPLDGNAMVMPAVSPQDAAQPPGAAPAAAFAESPPPDTVDRQASRLLDDTLPLVNGLLDPVRALLRQSSDLGEFRDGLAHLYPEMDASVLAERLSEAFQAAELAGRYEQDRLDPEDNG